MIIDINFVGLIITSIMASAVPLILASCGELITERSGVLNLGVEGMMIIGAISGFALMTVTGSLIVAGFWCNVSWCFNFNYFCIPYSNFNYKPCCNWFSTNYFWNRNFSNDWKTFCWYSRKVINSLPIINFCRFPPDKN